MGGVADGLTGGGLAGAGLRWRCGGGTVLAAFVLRFVLSAIFLMGVIQFLDKGIDVVEVVQITPQERIHLRIVEQIVDVPVPQVVEYILEVIKVISQEWESERIVELIVDVPVLLAWRRSLKLCDLSWSASIIAPFRRSWMFWYPDPVADSEVIKVFWSGCPCASWGRLSMCPFRCPGGDR